VIEGYIDPSEPLVVEGPFGDHTGFYSEADLYPQVHVTALTMRHNPVYATTIGRPAAVWRITISGTQPSDLSAAAQAHRPGDSGLSHAGRGIFHNLVFVSIDKQYPGQHTK